MGDKAMHRNWWYRAMLPTEKFDGAACAAPGSNPEWWTGDSDNADPKVLRANRRKAFEKCAECSCMTQCALYALRHPELQGVWGGTDETQRREMRKKMRQAS